MLVQNQSQLTDLQNSISNSKCVAIDTETTFTDDWNKRKIVGISVATKDREWYIPVGHNSDLFGDHNLQCELPPDLFLGDFTVVMHNAKFDLQILEQVNIKIDTNRLFDSMIMAHFIDENPPHGLKELAGIRLKWEEPKALQQAVKNAGKTLGYEGLPTFLMAKYAEQDARMTYDLFVNLWPDFKEFRPLWESLDRPFLLALSDIESRGLIVDSHQAKIQLAAVDIRLQEIQKELGFDPAKPKVLANKLFAPVPQGLGLIPKSFGISNRPTMDDAYLSSIGHPVTALVCEYRRLSKAAQAYYRPYLALSDATGRLHPTFKAHGTRTGRLSCENPNLQQVPRDSPIKRLFKPERNCELWEFDYSQMEFRLAAIYGKERDLITRIKSGEDVHTIVSKDLRIPRHAAKTLNFAVIYGAGIRKVAEQLNVKYSTAEEILENYHNLYPGIFRMMTHAEEVADFKGEVKLWTGRKRHFRYGSEHRKAFNSLVQGGAGELFKQSTVMLHRAGIDIRNLVHDAVWINIPKGEVEEQTREIQSIMSDWTEEKFGLRFTTDVKRLN